MKKSTVTVKQPDTDEVPTEVLAESIITIAQGIRKLRNGRLNDRALFLLIQDAAPSVGSRYGRTPVSLKEIRAVIDGIDSLEATFIRKKSTEKK